MKLTFFEKKVSQKTLIGCAANSGDGSGTEMDCAANGENKNCVPHKRDAVRLTVRLYGWNNPFSTNSPDSLNSSSITRERV